MALQSENKCIKFNLLNRNLTVDLKNSQKASFIMNSLKNALTKAIANAIIV